MSRVISNLLAILVLAAPALAQTPLPPGMPSLASGSEVWVARRDRPVVHGSIFGQTRKAIEVLTETDLVEVPYAEIVRIQAPGPPATKRGALIGGIVGGVALAATIAVGGAQCEDRREIVCFSGAGWTVGAGAVGATLGALAGSVAGSRMRTKVTIYPVPRRKAVTLTMTPLITRQTGALTASFRW
jgi:hypothetical protein